VQSHGSITGFIIFLLLFSFGLAADDDSIAAQMREVPELRAIRINPHAPEIDGYLNDAIWNNSKIEFARGFTQREPDEGNPATESTLVAVAYDNDAIYFAFWCYDSEPDKISGQLVRRDRYSESDQVYVRLDPYHDHQTGYSFNVNASGVQRDRRLYNENQIDDAWDGVWSSAVRHQPWGWSAELKIPYHCLRFGEKDIHTWGVDFVRSINRKTENVRWAFTPSSEGGFVSNFGHLTNLTGIKPSGNLELLPHIVSSFETEPESIGNPDGLDFMENIGLDFKYGLSTNLTLNATINPDFGQVELDCPVLNLSTYETFYPERRPFFMEGADLFRAEYTMFYSRRIGRTPDNDVGDNNQIYYTDYPKATTILGAAKLTGKLSGGTSIAFLSAITETERANYAAELLELDSIIIGDSVQVDTLSIDTVFREGVVEPKAVYSVLRIKQDVLSNSSIGGILTLVSQDSRYPAVTGGVDWRLLTNSSSWCFRGQTIFSRVDNENIGYASDAVIEKCAGKHIRGAIGLVMKDKNLNINRLGYTQRNDVRNGWMWMQYRTNDDWWIVRNSWNNINISTNWNYDGYNIGNNFNFNNCIQFTNNWHGGMGFAQSFGKYDDRETRGHGLWENPRNWNSWIWLDTDERKKLSVEFDFSFGNSRTAPWWGGEMLVKYRPISNMEFYIHGEYVHDFDQLMWVKNPDDTTTIFADKDQNIFYLDASASIVFRNNLSCQLSASGLLTGLNYYNYRPYLGNNHYGYPQSGFDHDYNYSALNSTLLSATDRQIIWFSRVILKDYSPAMEAISFWLRSATGSMYNPFSTRTVNKLTNHQVSFL
jgi:hypothetical protein